MYYISLTDVQLKARLASNSAKTKFCRTQRTTFLSYCLWWIKSNLANGKEIYVSIHKLNSVFSGWIHWYFIYSGKYDRAVRGVKLAYIHRSLELRKILHISGRMLWNVCRGSFSAIKNSYIFQSQSIFSFSIKYQPSKSNIWLKIENRFFKIMSSA